VALARAAGAGRFARHGGSAAWRAAIRIHPVRIAARCCMDHVAVLRLAAALAQERRYPAIPRDRSCAAGLGSSALAADLGPLAGLVCDAKPVPRRRDGRRPRGRRQPVRLLWRPPPLRDAAARPTAPPSCPAVRLASHHAARAPAPGPLTASGRCHICWVSCVCFMTGHDEGTGPMRREDCSVNPSGASGERS
jgi:hypothetical protein